MTLVPNLHFNGSALKAIALYQKVFDAQVNSLVTYEQVQAPVTAPGDYVFHTELTIDGARLVASDSTEPAAAAGNSVSIMVTMDDTGLAKLAFARNPAN